MAHALPILKGIALLGSNGGTDLRALIYHRLDALLGALGVPYKLIGRIDGDVAGPCEDESGHVVIIDSRDRDFALIGAVRWSANQSLWIIKVSALGLLLFVFVAERAQPRLQGRRHHSVRRLLCTFVPHVQAVPADGGGDACCRRSPLGARRSILGQ